MSTEHEVVFEEQLKQWVNSYARIFESVSDNVILADDEQIPPEEMRRYVENYKNWFEVESPAEEQKLKLEKLKKITKGWLLNVECLDKIIAYIENKLS